MSQPSRRRAVFARLVFGYAQTAFLVVNGILLVPLYLRHFDLRTYGAWLAASNIVNLLGILDGGSSAVVAQRLAQAHGAGDVARFRREAGAGAVVIGTIALVVAGAGLLLAPHAPRWVKSDPSQHDALALGVGLAAVGSALWMVRNGVVRVADAWQRALFVGSELLISLAASITAVLLGLFAGMGVAALGLGIFARGLVGATLSGGYVAWRWRQQRIGPPQPSGEGVRHLLVTTAPLFLGRSGSAAVAQSESLLVTLFLDPTRAAVLALTSRVFQVALQLVSQVQYAVYSSLAHLAASRPMEDQRRVTAEIAALAGGATALVVGGGVALDRGFVTLWVGADKYGGLGVVLALMLSTLALTQTQLASSLVMAFGRLRKAGWIQLLDAIARVSLIVLLLPRLGIIGMPLAAAAGSGLSLALLLRVLLGYLQLSGAPAVKLLSHGWLPLVAVLPAAAAAAALLPPARSWLLFAMEGAVAGLACLALVWLVSPIARRALRNPVRYLRSG